MFAVFRMAAKLKIRYYIILDDDMRVASSVLRHQINSKHRKNTWLRYKKLQEVTRGYKRFENLPNYTKVRFE